MTVQELIETLQQIEDKEREVNLAVNDDMTDELHAYVADKGSIIVITPPATETVWIEGWSKGGKTKDHELKEKVEKIIRSYGAAIATESLYVAFGGDSDADMKQHIDDAIAEVMELLKSKEE